MKKNILYIIFFMVLVACKREAVFELEGYSGQILREQKERRIIQLTDDNIFFQPKQIRVIIFS